MATKKAPSIDITAEVTAAAKILQPAIKRLTKALTALDPDTLPIGSVSDLSYDLEQTIKLLNTLKAPFDDVLAPANKALDEYFIQKLAVGESSGVQGLKSRTQINESVVPVIDNTNDGWKKFYAHIKKTGEFELLNKALNAKAIKERWDAKKAIPGVGKYHVKKVSHTKIKGK